MTTTVLLCASGNETGHLIKLTLPTLSHVLQKLQLSWEGGVLVMSEKMGAVVDTVVPMGTTLKLEYEKASS